MKTADFNYHLPKELIAQHPLADRQQSKLLVLDRFTGKIQHGTFTDITTLLKPGDTLVINNSKVIPARLFGIKEQTGAKVEVLILEIKDNVAKTIVGNAKVVKVGSVISFDQGQLKAECVKIETEGIRYFKLHFEGILYEILDEIGQLPLPPYITESLKDQERYQTVYAKIKGSAAAPTAGLHFTPELLAEIRKLGVQIVELTLHVGLSTFRPVKVDDVVNHKMHQEYYELSEEAAQQLNEAYQNNSRIISVGTTTTRVLETQMLRFGSFKAEHGSTDIFIYPGFEFKAISGLITNFHLPESTLLMLVSAFSSKDFIFEAYKQAIDQSYRFFSFGDAMMILGDDHVD